MAVHFVFGSARPVGVGNLLGEDLREDKSFVQSDRNTKAVWTVLDRHLSIFTAECGERRHHCSPAQRIKNFKVDSLVAPNYPWVFILNHCGAFQCNYSVNVAKVCMVWFFVCKIALTGAQCYERNKNKIKVKQKT